MYTLGDGKVNILRVIPDNRFTNFIDCRSGTTIECKHIDRDKPLLLHVRVPGLLNPLRFVDNNLKAEPLRLDQMELQVLTSMTS